MLRVRQVAAAIDGKDGTTGGGSHTLFRDDTEAIVDYVIEAIRVATLVLFAVSASALVAMINPLLLVAIAIPVLGGALTVSGLGRSLRARVRVGRAHTTRVREFVSGVMASLESIKIAGIEHRLAGRLESLSSARMAAERRENSAMETLAASGPVAMAVGAALLKTLRWAIRRISRGSPVRGGPLALNTNYGIGRGSAQTRGAGWSRLVRWPDHTSGLRACVDP